jgi:hypothetical protein
LYHLFNLHSLNKHENSNVQKINTIHTTINKREKEGDRPEINILRDNSLNTLKTYLGLVLKQLSLSALTQRLSVSSCIWALYCTDVIKLYSGEHKQNILTMLIHNCMCCN